MTEPIIFYDIPSKDSPSKAWSPNTWKTRFCLNVKGIPYKTVWVENPDIAALIRKIGALPTDVNDDGTPYYSLPAIYDPNTKTALADSAAIVRYLDRTYPDTYCLVPAHTDALHAAFGRGYGSLLTLSPIIVPQTVHLLPPRSAEYFRTTREVYYEKKLEEVSPPGSAKRAELWAGVEKAFATYTKWLAAGGEEQRFFLGENIGYADVTIASILMWMRVVFGEESKEWKEVTAWDGGRWARHADFFKKFEAVDVGEAAEI
ncbi:uncharacterized protein TRAVEDRAFT_147690 [Trametes versicolor FP-101664 SS1]|uniref:uncharacterized protein n=1 Tax=Trametes versicolor (strain FP-101664) TaxID=717944 RepID=UPI00046239BF|nr:uncharacterized protein TRAVEDRAFT_147690 [Trametes versicolor FP-101664 SS1]EIW59606.1 hypothetical protein TRAVEDRAFT_147690 [Trametes versicolor FP-101664 SS1]